MGTVCYVNSAVGLNVRDDAAGNIITHLNDRDLMKVISAVPIQRALNGVVYWWNYVYYYKGWNTQTHGYGWVAEQYTTEVSSTIPTADDTISNNSVLNQYQSLINARFIFQYLRTQGWTVNSIYAMIANMESESYVNPGKWEDAPKPIDQKGYGLVQWTPRTKYTNWLNDPTNEGKIANQLNRIIYERNTEEQWVSTNHSPAITFHQYSASTDTPENLSEYFLRCYEIPEDITGSVVVRRKNAAKWADILDALDF